MNNNSPIKAVNRPKKTMKSSSSSKARKRNSNSPKNKTVKEIPGWVYKLLMFLIAIVFIFLFYYFFIRPYSYRWKPCYGFKAYGICMPSSYKVHGIDISHHQGDINWKELSQTQNGRFPVKFIFMKASEGGDFKDRVFQENFDSARSYGFIRGAYHFYNPNTSAEKQADFFINSVRLEKGDLPPVLDIEKRGDDAQKMKRDIKLWLTKIENHYKVRPIIYASYKFKQKYLSDSIFNTYPYWIAHYYVDSVKYQGDWAFWQHSDIGKIPGIKKDVDLNIFKGTIDELKSMTLH